MVKMKYLIKVTGILLAVLFTMQGCQSTGDTSGFRPEKQKTRAEIEKNIEQIKNNPKMPDRAKNIALADLQQRLAKAK